LYNYNPGMVITTAGYGSMGLHARTSGDSSPGMIAFTEGSLSDGLYVLAHGPSSRGVYAHTSGSNSPALYGVSDRDAGVYGSGWNGGYFTTNSWGRSWYDTSAGVRVSTLYENNTGMQINTTGHGGQGVAVYTSGWNTDGVYVWTYEDDSDGVYTHTEGDRASGIRTRTNGTNSAGIYALTYGSSSDGIKIETSSDGSYGVRAYTRGYNSQGVQGRSKQDIGVAGYSENYYGVFGKGKVGGYFAADPAIVQPQSIGLIGESTTNGGIGIKARGETGLWVESIRDTGPALVVWRGPSGGLAADFQGNVRISKYSGTTGTYGTAVMELGEGLDYSEGFNVSETEITPGTVLVIDPENLGALRMSTEAYDRKVAGIVSGAGGLDSAIKVGGEQFDENVALAGRVYCNVDTSYGAIEAGDLLTTSATPGYAMVVREYEKAQGAILGKAMERLDEGQQGQILVLVTLQ
jgi:hypothetical protein